MASLYLTKEEKKIFDALSEGVRDGWEVEEENGTFDDNAEKMRTRLALLRLHDPKLMSLRDKASGSTDIDRIAELVQEMDLSGISEDDLAELFFALGPSVLSTIIGDLLKSATTDKDIDDLQSLTFIRHELLASSQ